jgi:hypothetical protein
MLFDFSRERLYLTSCTHALGPLRQTLEELARKWLLASSVESLQRLALQHSDLK